MKYLVTLYNFRHGNISVHSYNPGVYMGYYTLL